MTSDSTPVRIGAPHDYGAEGAADDGIGDDGVGDGGTGGDEIGSDTAEAFVRRHPGLIDLGRIGWVAKGIVYGLTGVVAVMVAVDPYGSSDDEASQSGAVAQIARQPFGEVFLWVVIVGLLLYAAWRLVTVILPADNDGSAWVRRVGYTASAITYLALAVTAFSLARKPGSAGGGGSGSGSGGEDAQVEKVTRSVMEWTGGRYLVGIAGLVVIGIGCAFLWKGVSASFEKQLAHRSVGPIPYDGLVVMGRIGWGGRAVMMGLIGVFLTRAAIRFDPNDARGLDDSLRAAADSSVGRILVLAVAAGLIVYGAYCIVSAPARRLVASDDDVAA
jgi:fumarate reductase subunit D